MARSTNPFDVFPKSSIGVEPLEGYTERQQLGDEMPGATSGSRVRATHNPSRIAVLLTIIAVGFLLLAGRVFALQITSGSRFRERAEGNRIRVETETAPRGILFDRNGIPLVRNEPRFTVSVTPHEIPEEPRAREQLFALLAPRVHKTSEELNALLASALKEDMATPLILADEIPYDDALLLSIRQQELRGVTLHISSKRRYRHPEAFAHVLGYVGVISAEEQTKLPDYGSLDRIGKTGAEKMFEYLLRGKDGKRFIEQNNVSEEQRVIAQEPAIAGRNAILTLDAGLQETLWNALRSSVERTHAPGGAAVALDPRTGEILALVSYPSYNADDLSRGLTQEEYSALINDPGHPFLFRPLMGEYPSGSTIKPIIGAAALQERIITDRTVIQSVGGIRVNQWFFPDWQAGGHGPTDIRKALAESVNTFFYTIGGGAEGVTGLGVQRITDYARRFGLGQELGVDLPGEASGFLPSREWKERTKGERWYIGDTYHLAIGQGDLLVTPLQVASYTAAIANGGTLYRPHLLKSVSSPEQVLLESKPQETIRENVVEDRYLAVIRQGLRQAVTSGSARQLASLQVSAAGKTGTAEAPSGATHAWFTAFAPYETPEIAITVIIEHGGEGHAAALPVAKEALAWYFSKRP